MDMDEESDNRKRISIAVLIVVVIFLLSFTASGSMHDTFVYQNLFGFYTTPQTAISVLHAADGKTSNHQIFNNSSFEDLENNNKNNSDGKHIRIDNANGNNEKEENEDGDSSSSAESAEDASFLVKHVEEMMKKLRQKFGISMSLQGNIQSISKNNFLFIKTPKVGGTTLAITLERYATFAKLNMTHPPDHMGEKSCGSYNSAEALWRKMINHPMNGGKISVFLSQACFYKFMQESQWWTEGKLVTIGLVREAWLDSMFNLNRMLCCEILGVCDLNLKCNRSRFVSAYRYTQERCMLHDEKLRTSKLCGVEFTDYISSHCYSLNSCSQQFSWMSGLEGLQRARVPLYRAANILDQYDLVLVIERLDECLVLMNMLFGVPFEALPYLQANKDDVAPMPKYPPYLKHRTLVRGIQADSQIYAVAQRRLQGLIDNLNPSERIYFNHTLSLLKEANRQAAIECNKPEANKEDDCLTTDPLIKKKLSCRHACVEAVARKVANI